MLPDILNLSKIDATEIIDFLYDLFYRDFIELDTFLAKTIYIDPRSDKKDDGKELSFWHVTTRDEKEKIWVNRKPVWKIIARYPDFDRAARLEWIKLILTNHDHEIIKMFYHKETNKKRNIPVIIEDA
ncbi:hypothetical protein [Vibrio sp.]|uniref:hypothetical protein n=1 Tax=Vibrio sp. TaxID=678 RepID=UPI003D13C4E2